MVAVRRMLAVGLITTGSVVVMAVTPSSLWAFPQGGGSETSTGSAPPGGAELTHTDELPGNATLGSIVAQPLAGDDLKSFNDMIGAVVDTFPNTQKLSKRGQATLGCVLMSYLHLADLPASHVVTYDDLNLQAAMLGMCLQLAQSLPRAARDQAGPARSTCGRIDAALTVRVTHSRSGYHVTSAATKTRLSRPGLNVSCRHRGRGLLISFKPRKRGQTLPQAGARELGIAYSNPSTKPLRIRTTFTAN